jgi:hypothetical protein
MVARWPIIAAVVLTLGFWSPKLASCKDLLEAEDIKMGEEGFLASLAVDSSEKARTLCVQNSAACVGPDRGEIALALIAARNSRPSLLALAGLVRFSLDGAYAEKYDSLVLSKSAAIQGILASLRPEKLHAQCSREFTSLAQSNKSALEDVHENMVCAYTRSIQEKVAQLLSAIRHGKSAEL